MQAKKTVTVYVNIYNYYDGLLIDDFSFITNPYQAKYHLIQK